MKKAIRVLAMILCVVMVASCFYGCTIKVDINVENQGGAVAVGNNTASTTQAPAATQAPATTVAPATTAAPAADSGSDSTTAAPAASDSTTAAPAADAAPTTPAEIVAEYAKVYNATKAAGAVKGSDALQCDKVVLEGSENSMLKGIADGFMSANGTDMKLMPYSDDNPANECLISADDIATAEYKDNGDGTATIKLVPKGVKSSVKFQDAQGKMFNVMEDIAGTLASISVISWSEGDANSNVVLTSDGGYCEVTYNKETKLMTGATYVLVTTADVTHCNVAIFKDKSASAQFTYTVTYVPA